MERHHLAKRCLLNSLFVLLFATLPSCGLFHIWPYGNESLKTLPPDQSRANLKVEGKEQQDSMFVGLALSGGGSRSAIFATQVMLELKHKGILQKVDFISSVSGGSLPAAYYALDGHKDIQFEDTEVLDAMGRNFQLRWFGRWFLPWNIVRYWFTDFTRSDIMVQVFDSNLFHGATYADLRADRPKLLINATNQGDGSGFTFSDEAFNVLQSNLLSFQVARAVNVSSAFPGAFQSVTLTKYSPPPKSERSMYYHLYDGGPVDNLGVQTLYTVLSHALKDKPLKTLFPSGCVLISVDAAPWHIDKEAEQADIREAADYIIDRDIFNSADVMLLSNRRAVLNKIGITDEKLDHEFFGTFTIGAPDNICHSWHIALRQISVNDDFGKRVTTIKTNFGLPIGEQEDLKTAAKRLVQNAINEGQMGETPMRFLLAAPPGNK